MLLCEVEIEKPYYQSARRYFQRAYVYKAKDKVYVQANKLLRQLDEKLTWKGYSVTIGLSDIEDLCEKYASVCTARYVRLGMMKP
jgi:hypothetical protein